MKKIGLILLCMLLCLGCNAKEKYTRDTTPGEYIEITYAGLQEKIENKETFVSLFSQTYCEHCKEYKETVLNPYIESHHVDIYELNIALENNPQNTFVDIQNYISQRLDNEDHEFLGTPFTLIVVEGEIKLGYNGLMVEEDFEQMVVKYQLDALKE